MYPNLTLPPEPIITLWGTWLSAVLYYSNNFEKIKNVVLNLDSDAANAIKKTIELMECKNLQNNLAFISANFGFLVDTISKLETSKMALTENLEIVDNAIAIGTCSWRNWSFNQFKITKHIGKKPRI